MGGIKVFKVKFKEVKKLKEDDKEEDNRVDKDKEA